MSIESNLQKMVGKSPSKEVDYVVHPKETSYFSLMVVVSLAFYAVLSYALLMYFEMEDGPLKTAIAPSIYVFFIYVFAILFFLFISRGILVGYLKGNAVKISQDQFPDVFEIAHRHSISLGLNSIPDMYLLQEGGFLNAFATKFLGRNFVVIYSEVLEEAYENNRASVEFIIGHELGHAKRNHVTKLIFLFPAFFVPFLYAAYSRACEYTCDRIGKALCPEGAMVGMILLASGKKLYKKVDVNAFMQQHRNEKGFGIGLVRSYPLIRTLRSGCWLFQKKASHWKFPGPNSKVSRHHPMQIGPKLLHLPNIVKKKKPTITVDSCRVNTLSDSRRLVDQKKKSATFRQRSSLNIFAIMG